MENEKSKETILDTDTKGVPCSFSITPGFFSPLPYQAVMNVENCFPPQSIWGHTDSRCYSMQILPPFPAQQQPNLTLLPSCLLPVAFHSVVGKKKDTFKKNP